MNLLSDCLAAGVVSDFALFQCDLAADEDIFDAFRRKIGLVKGGLILQFFRIEDGDIRIRTHIQAALMLQVQTLCRGSGHFFHSFVWADGAFADKFRPESGERAGGTGMTAAAELSAELSRVDAVVGYITNIKGKTHMDHLKHILSYTRRAVDDYSMIRAGDKIAVGVSAGKDSLTLLCAMAGLRRFYPQPFELIAITVDMGFGAIEANQGKEMPADPYADIRALCEKLEVPYHVVPSEIARIIFDVRKEQNPCSLCAKLRRGALNNAAKELGCNTVALGHHFDDAVETFMLNLFFEGRLGCFSPVSYLSRTDLRLIRPMIYMPEKDVRYFAKKAELPVLASTCPADGNTQREEMKQLIGELEKKYPNLRKKIFGAIQRYPLYGWSMDERQV